MSSKRADTTTSYSTWNVKNVEAEPHEHGTHADRSSPPPPLINHTITDPSITQSFNPQSGLAGGALQLLSCRSAWMAETAAAAAERVVSSGTSSRVALADLAPSEALGPNGVLGISCTWPPRIPRASGVRGPTSSTACRWAGPPFADGRRAGVQLEAHPVQVAGHLEGRALVVDR